MRSPPAATERRPEASESPGSRASLPLESAARPLSEDSPAPSARPGAAPPSTRSTRWGAWGSPWQGASSSGSSGSSSKPQLAGSASWVLRRGPRPRLRSRARRPARCGRDCLRPLEAVRARSNQRSRRPTLLRRTGSSSARAASALRAARRARRRSSDLEWNACDQSPLHRCSAAELHGPSVAALSRGRRRSRERRSRGHR